MTTIQRKEEIKDIFTAMDNLTKSELAMSELDPLNPGCCDENDCICAIPFCCSLTLPQGFEYTVDEDNTAKFAITKCCVKKIRGYCDVVSDANICDMPVTVTNKVLVEKVFGSINFILSLDGVLGDCGITLTSDALGNWAPIVPPDNVFSFEERMTSVCCVGNICIDKIVNVLSMEDADTCPRWKDEDLLSCNNFEIFEFEVITDECDSFTPTPTPTPDPPYACNEVIKIRGKLRLINFGPHSCCP